jgi:hypothetical protein
MNGASVLLEYDIPGMGSLGNDDLLLEIGSTKLSRF